MKKLILLLIRQLDGGRSWICQFCNYPLRHFQLNTHTDLYWCPRCKTWRWTGWTIRWLTQKRKPILIEDDQEKQKRKGNLATINRRIDKCMKEIRKRRNMTVKIYTSKDYDQDFLKSLVEGDK